MTDIDLFGQEIKPPDITRHTGKPKRKPTQPKGYAGIPGRGPDGETCRSCQHKTYREYDKKYIKCALTRQRWTNGPGSDIRARSPACEYWEAVE